MTKILLTFNTSQKLGLQQDLGESGEFSLRQNANYELILARYVSKHFQKMLCNSAIICSHTFFYLYMWGELMFCIFISR